MHIYNYLEHFHLLMRVCAHTPKKKKNHFYNTPCISFFILDIMLEQYRFFLFFIFFFSQQTQSTHHKPIHSTNQNPIPHNHHCKTKSLWSQTNTITQDPCYLQPKHHHHPQTHQPLQLKPSMRACSRCQYKSCFSSITHLILYCYLVVLCF